MSIILGIKKPRNLWLRGFDFSEIENEEIYFNIDFRVVPMSAGLRGICVLKEELEQ